MKYGTTVAFAADREASDLPWSPTDQTQTVELVHPTPEVAKALELLDGKRVYVRDRLITLNGEPTHTLTSFYREADVAGTPLVDPNPGPATQGGGFVVLTLQGLEPHEVTEQLSARMPTTDEAERLRMQTGEPAMVLERSVRTKDGRPVEFAVGIHRASMFSWRYTFDIPD